MKLVSISVIIIGILLILNLGGIATPSTGFALRIFGSGTYADSIPDYIEDEESQSPLSNFKNDPKLWLILSGVFLVVGAVGARAGLFGSAPPVNYYLGTLVSIVSSFILTDMIAVTIKLWEYGEGWMRAVTLFLFVPLMFMFFLSVISFWMGSDG